jgi:hypothetical protein
MMTIPTRQFPGQAWHPRRMRTLLALTTTVGLIAPAGAAAQLPAPRPPGKHAEFVRSWPVQGRGTKFVEPGTRISVTVASSHRKVRLAMIKVRDDGTPVRAVARRTLRRGTARFTLHVEGLYQLRVESGSRRYWSWLGVPCGRVGGDRAQLRLDSVTARPGSLLGYRIVNTSTAGCITAGYGYRIERPLPDGTWTEAVTPGAIMVGYEFPPGAHFAKQAPIPAELPVGRYRLVDTVYGRVTPEGPNARLELPLTAEFDVIG